MGSALSDRDERSAIVVRAVDRSLRLSPLSESRVLHARHQHNLLMRTQQRTHSKALSGRAARSGLPAPFGASKGYCGGTLTSRCRPAASHCACSSRCGLQRPPQADREGNEDVCRPGSSPQLSTALGLGGCAATHRAATSGHAAPRRQEEQPRPAGRSQKQNRPSAAAGGGLHSGASE